MSENGTESRNKTRKISFRKFISAILLFLLIAAFALFIFALKAIYPPADEALIRQEVAMTLNKDPNDLTNEDFAKIKNFTLKGSTRDIKLLENFTNLEELNLQHLKFKKRNVPQWLAYISQRFKINLPQKNYIGLSPLAKLSHLKKLDLYGGDFDDITPVSNIKSMEDLNISGTNINDISSLEKLTNLKKLNLFAMSNLDITPLANFPDLEELNLIGTRATSIEPLRNLKNLKILYIYDSAISDIEALRNLKKLESLNIIRTNIINFEPLKELTNIERLSIDGNQMACVKFIKDLPNIEILYTYGGIENFETLKQLKNVKSIWLNNCDNITNEQLEDLKKALPETNILQMSID